MKQLLLRESELFRSGPGEVQVVAANAAGEVAFRVGTFEALMRMLPTDAAARGRGFERLCKWYLENSPLYAAQLSEVWLWKDWPLCWGADLGIDLVARTHDGKYWAIQAKGLTPGRQVTKSEIDSFLAEAARYPFAYRLVIASTDEVGGNARKVISDAGSRAGFVLQSDLAADSVTWPKSIDDLRAPLPQPVQLRPHQIEAIAAIKREMVEQSRGSVIMACGTGKTLVELRSHEQLDARCTLVTVPSLALLQQTVRAWAAHRTSRFDFLIVCSDQSIADEDAIDQASLGMPVTTEPTVIRNFLLQDGPRVVFATYHSTPEVARALVGTNFTFDLIIADEAHRLVGANARNFASILSDSLIPSRRRLFFTATPRIVRGREVTGPGDADALDVEVVSMDDTALFGREVYRLPFGEAIRRRLLVDYRVLVVGVNNEQALELARAAGLVTSDGAVWEAEQLATVLGSLSAMREHGLRRALSFHNRVQDAADFAHGLQRVAQRPGGVRLPNGEGLYAHVSGAMPMGARRRALNAFAGIAEDRHAVLANARCLSEGVDIPAIDCVIFAAPRRSRTDILQTVGRAIRLSAGKSLGTILVSVVVGDGETPENILAGSSFDAVWEVLSALRDHDDVLAETFDLARRKMARGERVGLDDLGSKVVVSFPTSVGPSFFQAFASRVVERTTSEFEAGFEALSLFVKEHGHARPPTQFVDERGFPLGRWTSSIRTMRRRRQLREDRIQRLEKLPGWVWKVEEYAWSRGMSALRAFVQSEGRARVPQDYVAQDGFPLGPWVNRQRKRRRLGSLTPAQIAELEALPRWSWAPHAHGWEEGYGHLLDFVRVHGHARVPQHHRCDDGFTLGRWQSAQRASFAKGRLQPEQVARLQALDGFVWNARDAAWEEGLDCLRKHLAAGGDCNPAAVFCFEGYPVGRWVREQRAAYQENGLSPSRVARLEELDGWMWASTFVQQWERAFALLEGYVAAHGTAAVPKGEKVDGFALGQWVLNQRRLYKRGDLDPQRAERLALLADWRW